MLLGSNLRIGVLWIAEKCNGQTNMHAMHVGLNFSSKLGSAEERRAVVMHGWMGNKRWLAVEVTSISAINLLHSPTLNSFFFQGTQFGSGSCLIVL